MVRESVPSARGYKHSRDEVVDVWRIWNVAIVMTYIHIYMLCLYSIWEKLNGTLKLKVIAKRNKQKFRPFASLFLSSTDFDLDLYLVLVFEIFVVYLNPAKEQSVWFLSFVGTYTIKLQPAESNLTFCTVAGNYFCYSLANNFVTRPTPKCARIDCWKFGWMKRRVNYRFYIYVCNDSPGPCKP